MFKTKKKYQGRSLKYKFSYKKQRKNLTKGIQIFFWSIFSFFCLFFIAGFGLTAFIVRDLPSIENLDVKLTTTTTKIYDQTGTKLFYEYGDVSRQLVSLAQIPKHAQEAVIAIEDHDFYKHPGFTLTGILRTIAYSGGGSTITQQLVRNTLLNQTKTLDRKVKEFFLALETEKKYTKQEILERYLNAAPYGGRIYGIGTAAKYYFDKDVTQLNLAESAFFAALLNAPTDLSPYRKTMVETENENLKKSDLVVVEKRENKTVYFIPKWKKRQLLVLEAMLKYGYITKEKMLEALFTPLKFNQTRSDKLAPHFVDYVEQELIDLFSASFNNDSKVAENFINQNGFKVITSLDWNKQQIAEEVLKNQRERMKKYNATNAALVAIEPRTGKILAMAGSYDYWDETIDGQVNVTISEYRQPGSAIKPLVYAYAFEKGYSPATMLSDVKTTFNTIPAYTPRNFDNKFHGPMFIRDALSNSYNIPAVKMISLLGVRNTINFFHKIGITTLEKIEKYGPAVALGSGETKLIDLTYSFAVLANQGRMVGKKSSIESGKLINNYRQYDPVAILKVEDSSGKIYYEHKAEKGIQILSAGAAYLTWNVLSDYKARAPMFGANNSLNLQIRKAAAKTGTTTDYKDITTFGYTPSLAVGVWAGNNDGSEMKPITGSGGPAPIWNEFMTRVLPTLPDIAYPLPSNEIVQLDVCKITGLLPGDCPTVNEPFLKNFIPQETDTYWQKIMIDKATGKRALPDCPTESVEEKYYLIGLKAEKEEWQKSLDEWLAEAKELFPAPPDEDFSCTPPGIGDSGISLSILTPANNQIFPTTNVQVEVKVFSKLPISEVEFYLNENLFSAKTEDLQNNQDHQAFIIKSFKTLLTNLENGQYVLKVVAKDNTKNSNNAVVNFTIATKNYISISHPLDNSILNTNNLNLTVNAYDKAGSLGKVLYSLDNGIWTELSGLGTYSTLIPAISDGSHQIKVQAISGTGKLKDAVNFIIDTSLPVISLNASLSSKKVSLTANAFDDITGIKEVIFYANQNPEEKNTLIAAVSQPASGSNYLARWNPPKDGIYFFSAIAKDKAGNEGISNKITLTISSENTPT